jgi:hypothetical protein
MKTKHRKIITLQANLMRKLLKQVKHVKIDKNDEYNDHVTLWQNQASLGHSIKALSFNQAKLARLLRVVAIDYNRNCWIKPYGNFFSVKTIIVASINFDHFNRLQDNADAGHLSSKAEIIGLFFFHKARIENDQKVYSVTQ